MAKSKGLSSQDAEANVANGDHNGTDGEDAEVSTENATPETTRLAAEAVGTLTLILAATLHDNDSIHSEMQVGR